MNVYFHAGKAPYSTRLEAVMIGGVTQPDTAHTVNATKRRGTVAPRIAPPGPLISGAVRSMRQGYRAGLCLPSARPAIFEDQVGETGAALAREETWVPAGRRGQRCTYASRRSDHGRIPSIASNAGWPE